MKMIEYPVCVFFFFNDTATTEIYTLSLHDALPIYPITQQAQRSPRTSDKQPPSPKPSPSDPTATCTADRKSTRLNSSHLVISYAVFCLKKKNGCATRGSVVKSSAPEKCGPLSSART